MLTKLLRNMVTERFPASNAARVRGIARSTCRIAPRSRWNEGHEHLLNAMMKPFLAIIAIALVAPPAQAQELANEIVDGLDRICLYRTGKLGERTSLARRLSRWSTAISPLRRPPRSEAARSRAQTGSAFMHRAQVAGRSPCR